MKEDEKVVTPAEEEVPSEEGAAEKTETPSKEETEKNTDEPVTEEEQEDGEGSEVDYRQKYEALEKDVKQLKNYIRSREEDSESESSGPAPKVTKDEFLTEFANDPNGTLDKVIDNKLRLVDGVLKEVQQQQAVDFIRTQPDFKEEMYDDLLFIIDLKR